MHPRLSSLSLASLALFVSLPLTTTAQNITIQVISSVPCAPSAKTQNGDILSVNYNGTFTNGTLFDSSYTGNDSSPFNFTLGAGQVIKGWDLGLANMCVGDKRKLTLPPAYAYGNRTVGPIPPNSTLLFYTELMGVEVPQEA